MLSLFGDCTAKAAVLKREQRREEEDKDSVRQNARYMSLTCRDSRGLHHNPAMRMSHPIVPEQFNCLYHTRWPTVLLRSQECVPVYTCSLAGCCWVSFTASSSLSKIKLSFSFSFLQSLSRQITLSVWYLAPGVSEEVVTPLESCGEARSSHVKDILCFLSLTLCI